MTGKILKTCFIWILVGGILYTCTLLPLLYETIHQDKRPRRMLPDFVNLSVLSDWSFSKILKCQNFSIQEYPHIREALSLQCDIEQPKFVSRTSSSSDIFEIPFGHKCLKAAINSSCSDNRLVPNLVHYIWYNRTRMNFVHFLSFMSVVKFVKPCIILLHGSYVPFGPYWDYFVREFPYIIHVKRNHITDIGGYKLAYAEHGSDVMRIEALRGVDISFKWSHGNDLNDMTNPVFKNNKKRNIYLSSANVAYMTHTAYGGLYLDWDEIILRSVDKFRDYDMTMGEETKRKRKMGSQFIMAKPKAEFLELWYRSYFESYKKTWTYNALEVPFQLAQKHPNLIHIEENLFCRPDWFERKKIFDHNFNWSKNYAMHLFIREYKKPINEHIIKFLNTTLGSVSRHILFGNKELCK